MAYSKPECHLIGTHTRYSSWTSRVEAVLEYFHIPHTKQLIKLSQVKSISPTGFVPLLQCRFNDDDVITIGDSLAICEYLAEANPELSLWPRDPQLRALARSAAAQMHSGFSTVRATYGTNFVAKYTGNIPMTDEARKEIARILQIWDEARKVTKQRLAKLGEADGGFLFGGFSIADAFFWPVLWRFRTYGLPLDGASKSALDWMATMWNDPVFRMLSQRYFKQAEDPETRIEHYDDIFRDVEGVHYGRFSEDWTFTVPEK